MITNALCKYFANSTNSTVHLSCSIIVLAGDQKQRGEASHVFCIHLKWRSYGLVKGQKKSKGEEKRRKKKQKKTGTVPRTVPG